jgi:hypothetical protein
MAQLDFIPLRIVEFQPFAQRRTAHALGRALADDGNYYYVKANGFEPFVCATEWVCSSIADSLSLPVAPAKVLIDKDGELLFGAQEVSPRIPDIEVARILMGPPQNNLLIPGLPGLLSRGYAFDLTFGNVDRHEENYIIADSALLERGQRVGHLRFIDFGSADVLLDQKTALPFSPNSNTVKVGREVRRRHRFDLSAAEELISRLREGRRFIADRAMFGLPAEWLPKERRAAFAEWVQGSAFDDRLRSVENGLSDGTFL